MTKASAILWTAGVALVTVVLVGRPRTLGTVNQSVQVFGYEAVIHLGIRRSGDGAGLQSVTADAWQCAPPDTVFVVAASAPGGGR